MKKAKLARKLVYLKKSVDQNNKLSKSTRHQLEKKWDVETAYYSSALENPNLKKSAFHRLAKKVA